MHKLTQSSVRRWTFIVNSARFLEAVYQEALALELTARGLPVRREVPLRVKYKGQLLVCTYKADFICFGEILVELKAIEKLGDATDPRSSIT